jgi:hypothetical protein
MVNTFRTRITGRFGKNRDVTGPYGKPDISELGRKMRYSGRKPRVPGISPFLNGVQEVESSNLFAPTWVREFELRGCVRRLGRGPVDERRL